MGLRPVFSFGTKQDWLIDWLLGLMTLSDSLRGIFNFLKLCSWFNIIIGFNYRYAPSFKHVCAPLTRYPSPLFLPFLPPPYPVFLPITLIYTFFFTTIPFLLRHGKQFWRCFFWINFRLPVVVGVYINTMKTTFRSRFSFRIRFFFNLQFYK